MVASQLFRYVVAAVVSSMSCRGMATFWGSDGGMSQGVSEDCRVGASAPPGSGSGF